MIVDRVERLGWAVGHDATILRTRDGGETWERVYHDPDEESPLFDVWFFDTDNGFAAGAYGLFLATSDGGSTWDRRTLGEYDDYHLHHVSRSATGRLYMAAEAGVIYRSDDDGGNWVALPSPYAGSFFGTLPLEGDTVLLFGLRGHVFRSEDAGESWEEIETGTVAMINRGLRSSDGAVVLVGHEGTLLFSDDEGRRFRVPSCQMTAIRAVHPRPNGLTNWAWPAVGYPGSGKRMNLMQTHKVGDMARTLGWKRKSRKHT